MTGRLLEVKCRDCDYHEIFNVDNDLLSKNKESRYLYQCSNCFLLDVDVVPDLDNPGIIVRTCTQCKDEGDEASMIIQTGDAFITCPSCGEDSMYIKQSGIWDNED